MLGLIETRLLRLAAPLNHPRAALRASWIVPLLCGLLSLAMGQDDGWDMRNYHLYNAYALLNGRMGVDLSPAGFQSYFNPLLDVPYFLFTRWFAAPFAAFAFGALHGTVFVLAMAIVRLFVRDGRTVLLLSVACLLSAAFLSELGNSMGDNVTALFVLGSVYLLLRRWEQFGHWSGTGARTLLCAGAVMGLGLGLKLTNVSFAVGACIALFTVSAPVTRRVLTAFVYGLGVLAGMAASSGYWMFRLYSLYGNPFFPQFNNIFRSPMAAQVGVLDEAHLPRNLGEVLLWPFVFTHDMGRIAEVPIRQFLWPLLYSAVAVWAVAALLRRLSGWRPGAGGQALPPRAVFLLVFFAVSYFVWMRLFSIYRYLVPLELLAPLLVWLLAQSLGGSARRLGSWLLLASSLAVVPFTTWGHANWSARAFTAATPAIAQPTHAVVFQASLDSPMGWLAQFMPPGAAVIGLGSGFPESPAYQEGMRRMVAARGGPHYIMFPVAVDQRAIGMQRKDEIAQSLGLTGTEAGCHRLEWLTHHLRMKAQVDTLAQPAAQVCALSLQPQYRKDTAPEDRAMAAEAARRLRPLGLAYDPATCAVYRASVGGEPYPYRMCTVISLPKNA